MSLRRRLVAQGQVIFFYHATEGIETRFSWRLLYGFFLFTPDIRKRWPLPRILIGSECREWHRKTATCSHCPTDWRLGMAIVVMMRLPCWDSSNQHSAARTPLPLFFSFFFLFPLLLSISVFPFLVPFSFVLSFRFVVFRLFLGSRYSLLFSLPCFHWWRILFICYFVSVLHPLRAPWEPELCVFSLRAVVFLAFLMLTYFFFFSSSPTSIPIGTSFVSCLFLVDTMLSPRFRFLLRLV